MQRDNPAKHDLKQKNYKCILYSLKAPLSPIILVGTKKDTYTFVK